jgi:hypothetical protein
MPIYTLGKKTYEIFPVSPIKKKKETPALDNKKLCHIANYLSEFFGCFVVMGMSTKGEPQIIIAASSGMEHLALKQFAQDILMGDADVTFTQISGEHGEDDDFDSDEKSWN